MSVTHSSVLGPDFSDQVTHVIPLHKGDELTTQRRRNTLPGGEVISNINDVRNELLLQSHLRGSLERTMAFLVTSVAVPDVAHMPPATSCTVHLFQGDSTLGGTSGRVSLELGSPVRIADTDWPPAVLFDAVCASIVLKSFGIKKAVEGWPKQLTFGLTLGTPSEFQTAMMPEEKERNRARMQQQIDERNKRLHWNEGPDTLDLLHPVPYMAASPQYVCKVWAEQGR
ncbi:hypothetical protein BXZ70DRAFT_1079415 [Cristinia sonorae]|uniref:HNH nuclease domain-containing protein n=1 Tax=Cristinia sonorae TaxID=1940300 RepID=A0A8K0UIB3_9AGAR|nr:hypothetical protein BXZ70DRAFT_1079415 [Cristinia sonorae]